MDGLLSKKKARASHAKSKAGCRTCKVRRVKCDESKPACRNCNSTGRKCEGYGIWNPTISPTRKEIVSVVQLVKTQSRDDIPLETPRMTVMFMIPDLNDEERMCFDYFQTQTIKKLPGVFYSYFWQRLVLQACTSEPAVLHAVIALGSAHRIEDDSLMFRNKLSSDRKETHNIDRRQVFTIQEYSKAISNLRTRVTNDKCRSLRVVLITCVLFVTLELLRGENENAQAHTESGWRLMKELRPDDDLTLLSENEKPSEYTVDESLSDSLACLSIQSALFGCKSATSHLEFNQPAHISETKIPVSFRHMSEARKCFNLLLVNVLSLTQDCRSCDLSGLPYTAELRSRQVCLRSAIATWKISYGRSRSRLIQQADEKHTRMGVSLLRVFLSMASIMAETALSGGRQMIFDDYTPHFTSILTQTLALLKKAGHPMPKPQKETIAGEFIADVGMLPFMWFTALKCRVPWLRRQTIALLTNTPIREGMWDSFIMARVAQKIIMLEEDGFYDNFSEEIEPQPFDSPVANNDRLKHIPVLPESSRFYDVDLQMYNPKGSGKLVLRRLKSDGGGWEEITSTFDFSDVKNRSPTGLQDSPTHPSTCKAYIEFRNG
ncbi:hypothetical protein WAI453_012116 [Rhynchosporium graminicola]|uniref:Zn(2)-C6 fungal-type domain-containing protein n=1 Tax=Rhynchosporium graminicola TaxID=2792576 RepID=A0A1E1KX86_9HELO|nr:uncharacterized protein RCO7_05963 [Rhynchosporium commune]